ncbi:hypothetical protein LNKW23_01540 [Paralimibaculum aggregatum]|uniref:Uncharacterized protein n=1 Tax=Paralimibaculum aggregatum TaxID=3036245 RepID=A0ABQ6LC17_9RHOB|nr:hypothetical protein [Limibaculum sp. NKW23]GMG80942.1 hypothetical protein LNKW23_01540 [Limibaculum sp. NKW23]
MHLVLYFIATFILVVHVAFAVILVGDHDIPYQYRKIVFVSLVYSGVVTSALMATLGRIEQHLGVMVGMFSIGGSAGSFGEAGGTAPNSDAVVDEGYIDGKFKYRTFASGEVVVMIDGAPRRFSNIGAAMTFIRTEQA